MPSTVQVVHFGACSLPKKTGSPLPRRRKVGESTNSSIACRNRRLGVSVKNTAANSTSAFPNRCTLPWQAKPPPKASVSTSLYWPNSRCVYMDDGMKTTLLLSLLLALTTICVPMRDAVTQDAAAQDAPKKPPYEYRQEHDPDGIGKFYMGREIAHVMSYLGAGWLDRPEREKEEETSKLLPALKIKEGDVVADIGAGSGYYTLRLARLVGPKGKVLAPDLQPEMLKIIRAKMKAQKLANIEPILCTATDPKLPAGG